MPKSTQTNLVGGFDPSQNVCAHLCLSS
jgi:hypothetical protein